MIYSNGAKQAFYLITIAKVFNNIKVDKKLEVTVFFF